MEASRKNFSSRQKAEIYTRDRALCCFSGVSLWLLDYGAAPSSIDWADHITASAKGGEADIENGACASAVYNWVKRQHKGAVYLFRHGRPTLDFFMHHEIVPTQVADHLQRFSALHWSDWFFNRAVFHVLLAADQHGQRRVDGTSFTRDKTYWAKAALKALNDWRKFSENVAPLKRRGLVPLRPSVDQKLLLCLTQIQTVEEIKKIIRDLIPYVHASRKAMEQMAVIESLADGKALLSIIRNDPFVVQRTRSVIKLNIQRLHAVDAT